MNTHPRARLGLAGRQALVAAIEAGSSIRAAAKTFNVSPATAHKWWHRWQSAAAAQRVGGGCLCDRSSRPRRSPNELAADIQERICEVRRHTGWGPRLIAGVVGRPHSTVHRTLARHGISRPPRAAREPTVRYEWPCPGDLLHMDTKRYARFDSPGHAVTGDRSRTGRRREAGYEFAHSIVDDHSRLAYVELHGDERAETVVGFVERALAFLGAHQINVRRLMTDNAFAYTKSTALAELLATRHIRHIRTRAYRPQTNGKVERFQQTMSREWAYGLTYQSSADRLRALPHWLHHYNERRPPTAQSETNPRSAAFTTSPVTT
ncbi:MAG: IS481 family transposase, partial [Solirubrobacterales bacterium]